MPQAVHDPMADYEATVPRSKLGLRFSLLALFLFVTLTCLALAWLVQPERIVATALFEIDRVESRLMGSQPFDERELEIFKNTQLAKLKSYYVLQAAVRNPGIASLPLLAGQPDPVAWLQEHVEAEFIGDSELLAIRLRGPKSRAQDLTRLLDEVTKAYEDEVLYVDTQMRLRTRDLKAQSLKRLKDELVEKMQLLHDLKEDADAAAASSVDIQARQLEIDILTKIVRELSYSLEWYDIEANAPPRIKKVQPAVPDWDN
jgi:hypothetical protein